MSAADRIVVRLPRTPARATSGRSPGSASRSRSCRTSLACRGRWHQAPWVSGVVIIQPRGPGHAKLRLELKRAWERDPVEQFEADVHVTEPCPARPQVAQSRWLVWLSARRYDPLMSTSSPDLDRARLRAIAASDRPLGPAECAERARRAGELIGPGRLARDSGGEAVLLWRDEHSEAWLNRWWQRRDTGYHDHSGSCAGVYVISGRVWH